MFQDKMVLCASSAYEKKFYLNENFEGLPQHVKDELKIMCVLFTEDVGGVLSLEFDENGNLELNTSMLLLLLLEQSLPWIFRKWSRPRS